MSNLIFSVFLPDRQAPIRIEADSFTHFGCELVLHKDDVVVARSSDRGFVVRDDLMRGSGMVEHVGPATMSEFKVRPAPIWPFLSGAAIGVLGVAVVWFLNA